MGRAKPASADGTRYFDIISLPNVMVVMDFMTSQLGLVVGRWSISGILLQILNECPDFTAIAGDWDLKAVDLTYGVAEGVQQTILSRSAIVV